MPRVTRRLTLQALAGGATAALAGCGALGECRPKVEIRLTRPSDREVAESAAKAEDELRPVGRALALAAAEDGSTTYHAARQPPFVYDVGYLRVEGTYYRYRVDPIAEATITGTTLHLHQDAITDADGQSGDAVPFDELPVHDRRTFLALLEAYGVGYFDDPAAFFERTDEVDVTRAVGYADEDRAATSLLVPEPAHDYVRFHDHFFRLERTGTAEIAVTTYEVSLDRIEGGAEGVAEAHREAAGVRAAELDLTAEQREILAAASEEGYSECGEPSRPLAGLDERLADTLYIRYDGTWYRERIVRRG